MEGSTNGHNRIGRLGLWASRWKEQVEERRLDSSSHLSTFVFSLFLLMPVLSMTKSTTNSSCWIQFLNSAPHSRSQACQDLRDHQAYFFRNQQIGNPDQECLIVKVGIGSQCLQYQRKHSVWLPLPWANPFRPGLIQQSGSHLHIHATLHSLSTHFRLLLLQIKIEREALNDENTPFREGGCARLLDKALVG